MKVIMDNNVILDVFQNRDPFVQFSSKVLRLVETRHVKGYIAANSVTDIYYVLYRSLKDRKKVYNYMNLLLQLLDVIDVTGNDVKNALFQESLDFEDELISVCAKNSKVDYIITRNIKAFKNSFVPAITPEDFITKFFEKF